MAIRLACAPHENDMLSKKSNVMLNSVAYLMVKNEIDLIFNGQSLGTSSRVKCDNVVDSCDKVGNLVHRKLDISFCCTRRGCRHKIKLTAHHSTQKLQIR